MITHSQIIHFPIVLFLLALLLEIFSYFTKKEILSMQSLIILAGSLLASFLALNTGENAAKGAEIIPGIRTALELHRSAGELFIYFLLSLTLLKSIIIFFKKDILPWRILIILIMLTGSVQLYRTAHLGGILVYEWGAGVKPVLERYYNYSSDSLAYPAEEKSAEE